MENLKQWLENPKNRRAYVNYLNERLSLPDRLPREFPGAHKVQMFTTASDFPVPAKNLVDAFKQMPDMDIGWQAAFKMLTPAQLAGKSNFTISDATSGLSFAPVLPGGRANVFKVTGSEVTVPLELYGGALGFDKRWLDDGEFWKATDAAADFRAKYSRDQAQVAYDLISASRADSDVAFASTGTVAEKDAATINAAATEIIKGLENQGLDVNVNSPLVIIAPIDLASRIKNALRITLDATSRGGEGQEVNFTINSAMFTTKLKNQALDTALTASYFVVLPGRKNQWGNRMDLTIMSETDILAYAETVAGWGRYGGAIGETGQLRRCATS